MANGGIYGARSSTGGGIYSNAPSSGGGGGKKHRGFLGSIGHALGKTVHNPVGHVLGKVGQDLYTVGTSTPAGFYQIGKATYHSTFDPNVLLHPSRASHGNTQLVKLAQQYGKQTATDFRHPLRHPGYTLLDALGVASLGAGAAARVGTAARLGEGATISDRLAALAKPPPVPPRVLRAGGIEVQAPAARAALTRYVQRYLDYLRNEHPSRRIGVYDQYKRVGKVLERQRRVAYKGITGEARALMVQGRSVRWDSPAGMAMRSVAEETPLELMQQTWRQDLANAGTRYERKMLQHNIDLAEKAKPFVHTVDGKPEILPGTFIGKLKKQEILDLYQKSKSVALQGDALLIAAGHDPAALEAAISKPGQFYRGAHYEKPTPAKLGEPTPELIRARKQVDYWQKRHDKVLARYEAKAGPPATIYSKNGQELPPGTPPPTQAIERQVTRPRTQQEAASRFAELDKKWERLVKSTIEKMTTGEERKRAQAELNRLQKGWRTRGGKARGRYKQSRSHKGWVDIGPERIQVDSEHPPPKSIFAALRPAAEDALRRLAETSNDPHAQELAQLMAEREQLQQALLPDFAREAGGAQPTFGHVSETVKEHVPVGGLTSDMPAHLGPTAERIGSILGQKKADLVSLEAARLRRMQPVGMVGPGSDFRGGEFHVGYERRNKPMSIRREPRVGNVNTVGIPKPLGRLTHPLTGFNLHRGAFRNDVPVLTAENYLEAARHYSLIEARDFFIQHAQDTPDGIERPVPIRLDELKNIPFPPEVKDLQDAARQGRQLTAKQNALLGMVYDSVRQSIFPPIDNVPLDAARGVKWIDERLLGGLNKPSPLASFFESHPHAFSAFDAINNASKMAILYLKPAYAAPNIFGNAFLLAVQGGFNPRSLALAAKTWHNLDDVQRAHLLDLMGEGVTGSLTSPGGVAAHATTAAAHAWSKVVDEPFRIAAFIYEARKELGRGAKWQEVRDLLTNPAKTDRLNMVVERANRALIDYADLTPLERDVIRRIVFFYPWVKGATKYTGHIVANHPIQTAVLGAIGQQGQKFQAPLGPLPSWAMGLIPAGKNQTLNPTAAGVLNQPAQVAAAAADFLSGRQRARSAYELGGFLTPALQTLIQAAYGAQPGGFQGPEGLAALGSLTDVPLKTLIQQLQGKHGKTFPVTPEQALLTYLLGSALVPRNTNIPQLHKSHYAELKPRP